MSPDHDFPIPPKRKRPVNWLFVIGVALFAAWLIFGGYDCSGLTGFIGGVA